MKCAHCGAKLKEGNLYCEVCGKEAQIVPDYNILEDEELLSELVGDNKSNTVANTISYQHASANQAYEQKKTLSHKKRARKFYISVISLVLILLAIFIGIYWYVQIQHKNSYFYQMDQGNQYVATKNYNQAIDCYSRALYLNPEDIKARLALGSIYLNQYDYDSALLVYLEIIHLDSSNATAYQNVISIYEKKGQTQDIVQLSKEISNPSILALFQDYIVAAPTVDIPGGEYDAYLTLTLSAESNYNIYYTLDGSDPIEAGKLYLSPISLDEPEDVVLRAVCVNQKKIYSDELTESYQIHILAPEQPKAYPKGGQFSEETYINIAVPEGCTCYYTWDGTNPTAQSEIYKEPILIKEGNNVLSVIFIENKTKQESDIFRGNYIYYTGENE